MRALTYRRPKKIRKTPKTSTPETRTPKTKMPKTKKSTILLTEAAAGWLAGHRNLLKLKPKWPRFDVLIRTILVAEQMDRMGWLVAWLRAWLGMPEAAVDGLEISYFMRR